jgi:hypothetical protein
MCVGICVYCPTLYVVDKGEYTYACYYSFVNFDNLALLTTLESYVREDFGNDSNQLQSVQKLLITCAEVYMKHSCSL